MVAVKKPRPDRKQRLTAGQRLCPRFVMGSNIDATTPAGRMMIQMVSGAEMARVYSISQPTVSWIVAQAQDTCKLCSSAKHVFRYFSPRKF